MTTLILGPVRSGKSARAHALAEASGKRVIYAATAAYDPEDAEMRERIERHRRDRPATWTTVETAGSGSLEALLREAPADTCVLVEALGTWIAAQLSAWPRLDGDDALAAAEALDAQGVALTETIASMRADAIVVAEETGWGVVPPTPLGRVFRDVLGRLAQRIAARADRVELVVAGYAVDLRALGRRVNEV